MTRGRRVKYEKKEGEGMEYELREWRLSERCVCARRSI